MASMRTVVPYEIPGRSHSRLLRPSGLRCTGSQRPQDESARYNLAHPFSHDRSFIPMFMPW